MAAGRGLNQLQARYRGYERAASRRAKDWALLGLRRPGRSTICRRARLALLSKHQDATGLWRQDAYTGGAFPRLLPALPGYPAYFRCGRSRPIEPASATASASHGHVISRGHGLTRTAILAPPTSRSCGEMKSTACRRQQGVIRSHAGALPGAEDGPGGADAGTMATRPPTDRY